MSALNLLWMLPLCAVVSVVYSASRGDDWRLIARESVRRFGTFVLAATALSVAMILFSKYIQPL